MFQVDVRLEAEWQTRYFLKYERRSVSLCESQITTGLLIVTIKHPVMRGRETDVQDTLKRPDEIRQSRNDPTVHLFYKLESPKRWICAVVKRLNGDGFLITTFPTDAIKEGQLIWSN